MRAHLDIKIKGKVHGVYFRKRAKEMAQKLGIKGFVRRENDTLRIEAEGDINRLNDFVRWCKRGPEFARVSECETRHGPLENFSRFDIQSGSYYD
jgi:acylphosphatase